MTSSHTFRARTKRAQIRWDLIFLALSKLYYFYARLFHPMYLFCTLVFLPMLVFLAGMKITHLSAKFAVLKPKWMIYVNRVDPMRKSFLGGAGYGRDMLYTREWTANMRGALKSIKTFLISLQLIFKTCGWRWGEGTDWRLSEMYVAFFVRRTMNFSSK